MRQSLTMVVLAAVGVAVLGGCGKKIREPAYHVFPYVGSPAGEPLVPTNVPAPSPDRPPRPLRLLVDPSPALAAWQ